MNAAVPQDIDTVPSRDVGSVLQSARQAAGLSVADVSRQLNLGNSIVSALESGDMEALPPAAFVRGYLRSYAKLLELDVDSLLGQLDRVGTSDPDIAPVTVLSSQRASSDPLMRWMSVAVFFVLAVMVVIWWQTKNGVEPAVSVQPEAEVTQKPTQSQEMLALQGQARSQPETPPAHSEQSATIMQPKAATGVPVEVDPQPLDPAVSVGDPPLADAAAETMDGDGTTQPQPIQTLGEPAEAAVVQPSAIDVEPQSVALASATDSTDSPDAQMTTAAGDTVEQMPDTAALEDTDALQPAESAVQGTDELVLMIDGSSWAEVRDSLGQTLYYGLYDSPAPLRLTGQLPFVVFLGNSPAVTLLFNGDTHDQTSFNRANNTARFALDSTGLRRP